MPFEFTFHDNLAAIPAELRARVEAASRDRYDQTLPWVEESLRHLLPKDAHARFAVATDTASARAVAWLPLVESTAGRWPVRFRAMRSLSSYYCINSEPLWLESCDESAVAHALVGALFAPRGQVAELEFAPLASESRFFAALTAALTNAGHVIECYFRFGNWYCPVAGRSLAQYVGELPGAVRSTIERKRKKLQKAGRLEIRIVREESEAAAAVAEFEAVYARSWQAREAHPQFIRDVAGRFAALDQLRLGVLRLDGRPIAAQMWFANAGTASIFKLVYDRDFSDYSPGSVLSVEMLRQAIDADRCGMLDFLSGDDDYKKQWMSHRREMWAVRAYRRGTAAAAVARLRLLAERAGRAIRRRASRPEHTGGTAAAGDKMPPAG